MTELDKAKYAFLGYEEIDGPPCRLIRKTVARNLKAFNKVYDYRTGTSSYGREVCSVSCTEELIRESARKFYEENFKLHDVYLEDSKRVKEQFDGKLETNAIKVYTELMKLCRKGSVFDIPVEINGQPHYWPAGTCYKYALNVNIPDRYFPESIGKQIPFVSISLFGEPNTSMMATYVHELMHALIESRPGYTRKLAYREVLPVFIENVFVDTLNREELKKSKNVFAIYSLGVLYDETNNGRKIEITRVLEAIGYLLGLKLYEKYEAEHDEESKKEYLQDVQRVIDGDMMVEEIMAKRQISVKDVLHPGFLKGYL